MSVRQTNYLVQAAVAELFWAAVLRAESRGWDGHECMLAGQIAMAL